MYQGFPKKGIVAILQIANTRKDRHDAKKIGQIAEKLKFHLSSEALVSLARETRYLQRSRAMAPDQLVWSLLQSFATHQVQGIAGLHRSFMHDSGRIISYSAFHDQLSKPEFLTFARALYHDRIQKFYLEQGHRIPEAFRYFEDVRLHDGSSWAIHKELSDVFPGRFTTTSPAAVELHATYSLKTQTYTYTELARDTQSEHDFLPEGEPGVLHVLDRGYVNLPKLEQMTAVGGFYLVRAKSNHNPSMTAVNGGSPYQTRHWVGKPLKGQKLKRGTDYDFQVRMQASDGQTYTLRYVLLWNPKAKKHTGFLTNVPVEKASCQDLGKLYRLRWQIELSFKELKSHSGLKRFQSANGLILKAFALLSLMAMQLRRYLVFCAESLQPAHRLSLHKAAISAPDFMPALVKCMLERGEGLCDVLAKLFGFLQATMRFSNSHRPSSFDAWGLLS